MMKWYDWSDQWHSLPFRLVDNFDEFQLSHQINPINERCWIYLNLSDTIKPFLPKKFYIWLLILSKRCEQKRFLRLGYSNGGINQLNFIEVRICSFISSIISSNHFLQISIWVRTLSTIRKFTKCRISLKFSKKKMRTLPAVVQSTKVQEKINHLTSESNKTSLSSLLSVCHPITAILFNYQIDLRKEETTYLWRNVLFSISSFSRQTSLLLDDSKM